jgi:acetyltransferase
VGRLTRIRGSNRSEFAILVADAHQGRGLGTELLSRLVQVGRDHGVEAIVADILPENREMQRVSERVGFACRFDQADGVLKAELVLGSVR